MGTTSSPALHRLELHLGLQLPPQCEADLGAGPDIGTTERHSHPDLHLHHTECFLQ